MKRTYFNDAYSSTYPFTANSVLPFSASCIVGGGVCVRPNQEQATCPDVWVSSVEITYSQVTACLCIGGDYIGTVTTTDDNQRVFHFHTDEWDVNAWFVPGLISEQDIGTYVCNLRLDASCVVFLPMKLYGMGDTMLIHAGEHDIPAELKLRAAGLLNMSFTFNGEPLDIAGNTDISKNSDGELRVNVTGTANAPLAITDTYKEYPLVKSINGLEIVKTSSFVFNRTLTLCVKSPDSEDPRRWLDISPENDIPYDSIIQEQYPEPRRSAEAGRYSEYGAALLLTVNGSSRIPNCYGRDDEAASIV